MNEDGHTSSIRDKILTITVKKGWKPETRITFPEEGDQGPNNVPGKYQVYNTILNLISAYAPLTLFPIKHLLTSLKYHVFENMIENGAFALLEQLLHFPQYFQKYSLLNLIFS